MSIRWGLEEADAWSPVVFNHGFGIDDDLVGERIGVGGGDWRDVVFVAVYNGDDLVRGLFDGLAHGAADLYDVWTPISLQR